MNHLNDLIQHLKRNDRISKLLNQIDISWIDSFVKEHIRGLISKYGKRNVEETIDELSEFRDDEIISRIGNVVEVGGVLAIARDKVLNNRQPDEIQPFIFLYIALFDSSLNHYLTIEGVHYNPIGNYFNTETQKTLMHRIQLHIEESRKASFPSYREYASNLYLIYLLGLTDCTNLKWIN